uniref:DWARF 53 n=1 Tax=Triticum aestivum TaxID=4565 RepID=A0A1X9JYM1_WHEAT|nr:DWARF 53 [Triticum aestivum]
MPTPVPTARQCLSPAAVTPLDAAVVSARRRVHAQTTSLHLVAALLAQQAPPLLRDALARARSAAYSPRVQLKALELCFAVSLDRLPSASASSSASGADEQPEPPVSNSLMAAIKRSQANQRRNPDTYHFYHQAAFQAATAASQVRVELSQLLLAILDDPVVSRVFDDAGFRSADIKLAILRPAPPMPLLGRLPTRARPPPLFLCSFAAADDADVPSPAGSIAGGAGEENGRRIAEILARGRNPMLVGVGAASAAADFAAASPYRVLPVGPNSIDQTELGVEAAMASATSGLVISVGDLRELVPDDGELQERGRRVVAEVTRVLETHREGRVWVMGWSATYETYLTFLSKFPLVDKDWELQLLPITAVRAGGLMPPATTASPLSKSASLVESFVPFGGLVNGSYESNSLAAHPCPQTLRCQQCNDRCEQEVTTIVKGSGITAEGYHHGGLPSLLQNGSMMGLNSGLDAIKVRDDQMVLKSKILNLQKKWNEYCLRLHQGSQRINTGPYQVFPHYTGVPVDTERSAILSKGSESVTLQREVIRPSAVSATHTNATPNKSVSPPSISNQRNEGLVLNLQGRHSKGDEQFQDRHAQLRQEHLSSCHDREDSMSPSAAASVATDLVLSTPRGSSSKGTSSVSWKHAVDAEKSTHLTPSKVDDLNMKPPQPFAQSHSSRGSTNMGQPSPSALHSPASGGVSAFGQWRKPSHLAAQGSDLSDYKLLVERLFKVVGRQEEALSAICGSIVGCQSTERRRGTSRKNDIWFSFHGFDSMAKRRVAVALAELVHGSQDSFIYLDLSLQDWGGSSFRGKTGIDCIVDELSKKRRCVIFLDNIDKVDCLIQDSLSHAVDTGRFRDMRGKEVAINDSIVILSTRLARCSKNVSVGVEEGHTFSEEKILAARGQQLKILIESGTAITSRGPSSSKVVVSPLTKLQASVYSGCVSKRKLDVSDDQEKLLESPSNPKRPHRTSSVPFDLNLPVGEDGSSDADADDSSSNDNPDESIDSLLGLVDGAIEFKAFDFGKLANDILQDLSNVLSNILASGCTLEVGDGAMEQMLAASWASEDGRRPLRAWLEQVFARSLEELKLKRSKQASSSALRLVACEDGAAAATAAKEDGGFGPLLPSRIILEWR